MRIMKQCLSAAKFAPEGRALLFAAMTTIDIFGGFLRSCPLTVTRRQVFVCRASVNIGMGLAKSRSSLAEVIASV